MKTSHKALALASALLFSVGVGTAGYAGYEILGMNSNLGLRYMPKLEVPVQGQAAATIPTPHVGDVIGSISIPRINKTIPIIEGTGAKELKMGVGHYVGSVLPGIRDNSVLAGHRETVFKDLGQLKIGDLITINSDWGVFVYEVHKIRIVKADDKTVIVPTKDAILTLSTCYPFNLVGSAPKRYIVQAGLIIDEPNMQV